MLKVTAQAEKWPLAQRFTIARGSKDAADVVLCTVTDGTHIGRGECVPYARYGESLDSVIAQIQPLNDSLPVQNPRDVLQDELPAGAARFALDAALWDLEAKQSGTSIWNKLNIDTAAPLTTAYTISYDTANEMAANAAKQKDRPLLKIKLASKDDIARLQAVRDAVPDADMIVDANEGWSLADFEMLVPTLQDCNVIAVEQPLPAGQDKALKAGAYPFWLCADESVHARGSLPEIIGRYDMINIKLDKTGGLTEALALAQDARAAGLRLMVGCMVGTSLAMAPAMAIAAHADLVDLDGPLLLAKDRPGGMRFKGSLMAFPQPDFWGGAV
ncbi:MAG: N-acetyl-D-Glu racemase DgcA [Pseudomonadota bacterium]